MKRNIPTRIVETGRVVRGPSGQGVGWLQSLVERARNLRAQIVGVQERLTTPFADGVPAAVIGETVFQADLTRTITIPNFPLQPDQSPPVFVSLACNPIFLAGQTYKIPIMFPPPGVFMAHNLVVGIEAGFNMFAGFPRQGITPLNDYRQVSAITNDFVGGFTLNPSLNRAIRYTSQQQVLGDFTQVMPFIPYFWNIVDEKSGRQYAQDWMPHGSLLNTRGTGAERAGVQVTDSELFEFDTPWLFERDGQASFLFRPIMDLYQIAASDVQLPYGWGFATSGVDDRSAGRRTEQATVRVEFHGNRYYTAQDVLKDGALVTNGPEPRRNQPYTRNP